jgi:SAM-dependent methyltransferase
MNPDAITAQAAPRIMRIGDRFDPSSHYGPEYYGGGPGIQYTRQNGEQAIYHGPARTWEGFEKVIKAIDHAIPRGHGRKLIDIGCSSGDFIGRALKHRWNAYGVDLSAAASASSPQEVKSRIFIEDITKTNTNLQEKAPFDICTTWDFWEHIFHDDLNALTESTRKLIRPFGLMINDICTTDSEHGEFIAQKDCTITQENNVFLCSGHVNVRTWGWWKDHFESRGFKVRNDIAYEMQVKFWEQHLIEHSWSPRNLLVLERLP